MKVKIEIVDDEEEEIVIRCNTINDTIQRIQAYITDITNQSKGIIFYKDDTEYYIPINEIVFF